MTVNNQTEVGASYDSTTSRTLPTTLFHSTFRRVANRAWHFISPLQSTFEPSVAESLRNAFSESHPPAIDYDRYAVPFAYNYFITNYWKTASALISAAPLPAHRITDAGCGSGAATLAYLSYMSAALGKGDWALEVTLVDRSAAQLALARALLEYVRGEFDNIRIMAEFKQLDLRAWRPGEAKGECVLLGHVLTENRDHIAAILDRGLKSTKPDGRLMVIERTDDEVWTDIERCVSELSDPIGTTNATVKVPDGLDVRTHRARYLSLLVPHTSVLPTLVAAYFEAWKQRSPDLLDDVFTTDAVYLEKPFSAPYNGLEAIKEYWRNAVLPQTELELNVHRTVYVDNEVFVEWSAEFVLAGKRSQVRGVLILSVSPGSNRVHLLREYFRTSELVY